MSLAAVILAAGAGTRMRSPLPKVLHAVAERPMLVWVLDAVAQLRPWPDPVAVVLGHGAELVRKALSSPALPLRLVYQDRQLGTADAVLRAQSEVAGRAKDVLVLYGDTPLIEGLTLRRLVATHRRQGATLTLISTHLADPSGYGRVLRAADGSVSRVVEHREATLVERQVTEVNAGMYVFRDAWLWSALQKLEPAASGETYLTDLVGLALATGETVQALVVESASEVLGVNTMEELAVADRLLRARTAPPDGSAVAGRSAAP